MERRDLGRILDEVDCSPYHQSHFVGIRNIPDLPTEIRRAQIISCLIFCAKLFKKREQGPPAGTKLREQYLNFIIRWVLVHEYLDDRVFLKTPYIRASKNLFLCSSSNTPEMLSKTLILSIIVQSRRFRAVDVLQKFLS